jgi:hypothetical protein
VELEHARALEQALEVAGVVDLGADLVELVQGRVVLVDRRQPRREAGVLGLDGVELLLPRLVGGLELPGIGVGAARGAGGERQD